MNLEVRESEKDVTSSEIENLQNVLNCKLPSKFIELIFTHNGGALEENNICINKPIEFTKGGLTLDYLHSYSEILELIHFRDSESPVNAFPFAEDAFGNSFYIGLSKKEFGRVYVFIHDEPLGDFSSNDITTYSNAYLVANDLETLLQNLEPSGL